MSRRFQRLWLTRSITVIMMTIATCLLVGCPGSTSPFNYQVQVLDSETGRPIEGALVIIATGGKAPIGDDANSEGFAIIRIDGSYVGQMSEVTVTAPGYKGYFTDVNLKEDALPKTIRLKREMGSGETLPTATPAPSVTDTPPAPTSDNHTLTPKPPPTNTATSRPAIPADTATPEPMSPSSSLADAVVLENGAELRPGTDTWWYARQTLPARTELELLGYDPNFAGWVYVRTVDGASTGWTQIENLQINRELPALPRVTPRPTLTPAPTEAQPSLSACKGGPLTLIFYYDPGSERCTSGSGWAVNIHFIVNGGNCIYTYYWENELIYGPTTEKELIYTVEHGSSALVGNGEVRSGSQSVKQGIYVDRPDCP